MFSSVAAKALLGVAALGVAGGTTALAASPSPNIPGPTQTTPQQKDPQNIGRGVIVKLSDTSMTIERAVRDKTTKKVTKDDTTLVINATTKVYRAGSKDPVGHDALKVGERVRLRFSDENGQKVAKRVVILPDLRMGKVIAKGNDYFILHTPEHGDVKVVVTDKTKYRTGKDAGSFAALKVGDRAVALGEEDNAHNFDASAVRYHDVPRTAKPGAATAPTAPTAPAA
jgi:hypothetical protein